jgi:flagellar basal body P-ring protein FlgI
MARDGIIERYLDNKTVEKELLKMYLNDEDDRPLKNVKNAMNKVGGRKDV